MEEFPSNSRTPKPVNRPSEAEKKVVRVVTGEARTRRKPLMRRFAETFIAEDASSVGRYLFLEVLIPAAKDMILDLGREGLERTLFGGRGGGRGRSSFRSSMGSGSHVSYNRYSSNGVPWKREEERTISQRGRRRHDFREIVLDTRQEANDVIDQMYELVSKFGEATVADLYDMCGIEEKHTDGNYGWRNLEGSRAVHVREGYVLDLPAPVQLD